MNIFADFQSRIASLLEKRIAAGELPRDLDLSRFVVEPPREATHGDLSTNAAMVYAREAKQAGSNPRALAETLVADLSQEPDVKSAEAAGPGFINIVLKPEVYEQVLKTVLIHGQRFGAGAPSAEGPVNVEYVSANPTGPMHVGHARGAVFGDALSSLLIFSGREATREYYINDAGGQVDVLARSAFLRYREALGEDIGPIPEGLYPGDYLKPVGESLAREHGVKLKDESEAEWLPIVRKRAIDAMMAMIRDDLAALNITHEDFASERALTGAAGGAVPAWADGRAKLEVRLCQLVRLMRAGAPVKMSKRSGEFVTLREVVDEVGADAVRFMMLMRKNDATLDFDLAKVIEQSQDNPVFYVQYAHARARSVLRQGKVVFADFDLDQKALAHADFSLLTDEGERELMRTFGQYPRVVRQAAEAPEPHRIAFFAHDLATRFHAHWNRGKDAPRLRFVNEKERNLSYARLALVAAASLVLASALSILGVSAPEEMR